MTYSQTCIEQRQLETEKTHKLITVGIICSIAFHGVAFSMMNYIEKPLAKEENKLIELIVVQEPEPELPKTKPEIKPQAKLNKVESPKPQPQSDGSGGSVRSNFSTPQPREAVVPSLPPQKITKRTKISTPIATESNPVKPEFNNTPTSRQTIENTAPIQPQPILTRNIQPRNNTPSVVKPIEENNSIRNNSWSNSFNSSPRAVNNSNSNTETSVSRFSEDVAVSSGRISRSSTRVQSAVTGSNNGGGNIDGLRNSLSRGNGSGVSSIPNSIAATSQSIPPESIKCIINYDPIYPSELQGAEGKATVKVNLDGNGNVLGVSVINPHSNGEVNRQALLAARQMRFSSPSVNNASIQVSINFTVAGSKFDRLARQKKEEQERQARLAQDKERQARQSQLEKERLQRQQKLEKERQEREQQLREIPAPITPSANINHNENKPSLELEEKPETTLQGEK